MMTAALVPTYEPPVAASTPPRRLSRLGSMSGRKTLRRVWVIWALLFFNVLSYAKMPTVIPIPHKIGQVSPKGRW